MPCVSVNAKLQKGCKVVEQLPVAAVRRLSLRSRSFLRVARGRRGSLGEMEGERRGSKVWGGGVIGGWGGGENGLSSDCLERIGELAGESGKRTTTREQETSRLKSRSSHQVWAVLRKTFCPIGRWLPSSASRNAVLLDGLNFFRMVNKKKKKKAEAFFNR